MGITNKLNEKLHKVIMSIARAAIGNYCRYKSINYILKKCNLLDIKDLILFSSLSLYHKLYIYKMSEITMDKYYKDISKRTKTKFIFRPSYQPKLKVMQNTFYYKGATIYNDLPQNMKLLNHDNFQN